MSVKNILRRSTDVDHSSPHALATIRKIKTDLERPLSEYDNIQTVSGGRTNFPLAGIQFRFTESFPASTSMSSTSNASNEAKTQTTTTLPAHQYENVLETLQLRNKQQESDQQVKTNENGGPRSVMSVAKSSFFGLNDSQKANMDDDIDKLIEDIGNATIVSSERVHYENIEEPIVQNVSATSSASGSSSTTVTPSSSPTRQERPHSSRKNSEGSNRSKSPKFMLPEVSPSSPSQSVYMSTTVPQNIKGQNIMGRHKPTRQSLRHSRHIVTSKHFQGHVHSNSLNIRHAWLAKFVLLLKIVTGISILGLGGWICLFANSTPIQQNPFWSGLMLILSGLLGIYLLSFRRTRSKLKANFFWFLKMTASVIILMSVFLTTLAFIYASFHYISIASDNKKCFPENVFINSSSCICVFNVNPEAVLTRADLTDDRNIVHFRDLSCNELPTWSHILLASMILNFVGLVLSVCFMTQFIFGCKRRRKKSYVSVRNGA